MACLDDGMCIESDLGEKVSYKKRKKLCSEMKKKKMNKFINKYKQRDTKEISRQSTLKINYFADGN